MRRREDRGNGRGGVSGGKKARFSRARGWGRVGQNRDLYCIGDSLVSSVCDKRKIIDVFGCLGGILVYFYSEFDYNRKQTEASHVVWGQTHGFPGVRFRPYGAAPPSDPYPRGLVGGVILTAGSEPGNTPLGNRTRPHVRPAGRQRQQTLPGSASASRDPRLRLRNPRHLLSTGFPLLNDVQA